jgi:hypothetical protein
VFWGGTDARYELEQRTTSRDFSEDNLSEVMIRYSNLTLIRHRIFLAPTIWADIAIDNLARAWRDEQRAGCTHRDTSRTVLILSLRFRQFFHPGLLCACRDWPR